MPRKPHTIAIVTALLAFNIILLVGCSDSADDGSSKPDCSDKVLLFNHSSVIANRGRDSEQFVRLFMRHFQLELEGKTHPAPYSIYKDLSSSKERYYVTHTYSGRAPEPSLCRHGSMSAENLVLLDLTFESIHFLDYGATWQSMADSINDELKKGESEYDLPVDSNGLAVAPVSIHELMDLTKRILEDDFYERLNEEARSMPID